MYVRQYLVCLYKRLYANSVCEFSVRNVFIFFLGGEYYILKITQSIAIANVADEKMSLCVSNELSFKLPTRFLLKSGFTINRRTIYGVCFAACSDITEARCI